MTPLHRLEPALNEALDRGVTFIDTADAYGDGRSERLISRVLKERRGERPFVATKGGRRLPHQTVAGYTFENLNGWIERGMIGRLSPNRSNGHYRHAEGPRYPYRRRPDGTKATLVQ